MCPSRSQSRNESPDSVPRGIQDAIFRAPDGKCKLAPARSVFAGLQYGPKLKRSAPKRAPRQLQQAPKESQGSSNMMQKAPKRIQDVSKLASGGHSASRHVGICHVSRQLTWASFLDGLS
eukprot:8605805-Pyramimonas_sp.AAC.1